MEPVVEVDGVPLPARRCASTASARRCAAARRALDEHGGELREWLRVAVRGERSGPRWQRDLAPGGAARRPHAAGPARRAASTRRARRRRRAARRPLSRPGWPSTVASRAAASARRWSRPRALGGRGVPAAGDARRRRAARRPIDLRLRRADEAVAVCPHLRRLRRRRSVTPSGGRGCGRARPAPRCCRARLTGSSARGAVGAGRRRASRGREAASRADRASASGPRSTLPDRSRARRDRDARRVLARRLAVRRARRPWPRGRAARRRRLARSRRRRPPSTTRRLPLRRARARRWRSPRRSGSSGATPGAAAARAAAGAGARRPRWPARIVLGSMKRTSSRSDLELRDVLGAAVAEEVDQALHELLGRAGAGGDADDAGALQPLLLHLRLVVDQVRVGAVVARDVDEPVASSTSCCEPMTSTRSHSLGHLLDGRLAVGRRVADVVGARTGDAREALAQAGDDRARLVDRQRGLGDVGDALGIGDLERGRRPPRSRRARCARAPRPSCPRPPRGRRGR